MIQRKDLFFLQTVTAIVFCLLLAAQGFAAQSSVDVTTDNALKEKLRQQIIGKSGTQAIDEEYKVGYRDILHISVYGEGSMSVAGGIQPNMAAGNGPAPADNFIRGRGTGIEVRLDGRISLRNIGDVSVVGMTLTQIADYLKQLYATIYDDPVMTVTLVQSNSLQYTVMGQVINPGLFHLDYPITTVRAVARAGGFTEWANSNITIIRSNSERAKGSAAGAEKGRTFTFDFDDFLKGRNLEKNITIESGDVIVVH